jgi:hypothetical protein
MCRAVDDPVGALGRHGGEPDMAIRSASLPVPAVSTTSGLAPKSVNAPASAGEALAWANASTKLRRLLPVVRLARASRPPRPSHRVSAAPWATSLVARIVATQGLAVTVVLRHVAWMTTLAEAGISE